MCEMSLSLVKVWSRNVDNEVLLSKIQNCWQLLAENEVKVKFSELSKRDVVQVALLVTGQSAEAPFDGTDCGDVILIGVDSLAISFEIIASASTRFAKVLHLPALTAITNFCT